MTDFTALLEKPMDDIEKPKPLPVGSYLATIGQHKFDKAKNEKQTPYVSFPLMLAEPLPDVDAEALAASLGKKQLSEVNMKVDMYLTDDAAWRLKDMLEHAGVEGGLPLGEAIQQAVGRQLVVVIGHTISKKDASVVYANVDGTAAVPE